VAPIDTSTDPVVEPTATPADVPTTFTPIDAVRRPVPPAPEPARVPVASAPPHVSWRTVIVAALVAALVGAGSAVGVERWRTEVAPDTAPASTSTAVTEPVGGASPGAAGTSVREVAAAVSPSVARVEVTGSTVGGGGASTTVTSTGSAVIVAEDGYLLTNAHVVAGASGADVILADGTRYAASVVGTDPTSDLAVLEVDAEGLPAASFAEDLPEVGDPAVAIGSPFGLDGSVTSGIVSALDRSLHGEGTTLTGLIQTDAAINPGNSGGALVDDAGRIIGINTAIYSRSGANDGVGFAVPAATATAVAERLIAGEEVRWPVLGLTGQDVDPNLAAAYGLATDRGVLVADVFAGGAADAAGLVPGDIVTAVAGTEVASVADLVAALRTHEVGDTVVVGFLRDGVPRTVDAALGGS
jgi:S1-C subfamily serine protease